MATYPNIIFVMADDMGWGDIGCYNPASKIPTPNIDRLAKAGIRFTDAHSPSSVCTPARYGTLTGRYCWRTRLKEGVTGGYEKPLIEPDRLTVASLLKQRDYHCACIGKWHVGAIFHDVAGHPVESEKTIDFSQPVAGGPDELGFDYAWFNAGCGTCAPPYGFIENRYFVDSTFRSFDKEKQLTGRSLQASGMMGDSWVTKDADSIITDKACRYIESRAGEPDPFFLYLAPNAPHEPCSEQFVPDFAREKSKAGARGDLVWLFDWIVGQVMDVLERTGQAGNTLLIITSDNGPLPGDFVLDKAGNRVFLDPLKKEYAYQTYGHHANGDWRGFKAHIWEGGHRIPFIARWPETIPSGTVSDELVCLNDLISTCAAITEQKLPIQAGEDSYAIPSLSACTGNVDTPVRDALVHHSSYGVFSIRRGRWKMVLDCEDSGGWPTPRGSHPKPGTRGQLYDMVDDPRESSNCWDTRADVVASLRKLLKQYQDDGRSALFVA